MGNVSKQDENKIVYQSNAVVQAKRKMTIDEARMFYVALSMLNPRLPKSEFYDNAQRTIQIPVAELVKMYGNKRYYQKIREIKDNLKGMGIEVYTSDKKWKDTQIFEEFDFDAEKRGTLNISFTQKIAPYLLELTDGGYTKLFLQDAFKVNSHYALRILELMLQYRNWHIARHGNKIIRTISVDDLRAFYGLDDDKYSSIGAFKTYCVSKPMDVINKKTNYNIEAVDIKERRRITAFKFILTLPDNIDQILRENELDSNTIEHDFQEVAEIVKPSIGQQTLIVENNTVNELMAMGVSPSVADDLVSNYDEEYCLEKIKYAKQQQNIKNEAGWIVNAIRKDYKPFQYENHAVNINDKRDTAYKFFLKIGYGEVSASVLAEAAKEKDFGPSESRLLKEKELDADMVRDCYLKNDFSRLLDDSPTTPPPSNQLVVKERLQRRLLEAFRGGPKLTLDEINEAADNDINLEAIAKALGTKLKNLI